MSESPDASPSDEDDDDGVCFPGDATVTLESGAVVPMSAINIGDRVHVGRGVFSDVFMFTHKTANIDYRYVLIESQTGARLRLTPSHYLYLNGELGAAKTAKVGDRVELADGRMDIVLNVGLVKGKGLYNPQTIEGDIVVDGVRASTYTKTVEPGFAHAVLAPLRAIYRAVGLSTSALDNGSSAAYLLPSGQSVY